MSFVSCEKWLDLQQEGEITASQLYGKGEGYRTALNGLYQAMGRPDLYGRESGAGANRRNISKCIKARHAYASPIIIFFSISPFSNK